MGQNFDKLKCDSTFWQRPNILKGSVFLTWQLPGNSFHHSQNNRQCNKIPFFCETPCKVRMDAFLFFICYNFLLGAQKLTLDLQLWVHFLEHTIRTLLTFVPQITLKVRLNVRIIFTLILKKCAKIHEFLSKNMDKIL